MSSWSIESIMRVHAYHGPSMCRYTTSFFQSHRIRIYKTPSTRQKISENLTGTIALLFSHAQAERRLSAKPSADPRCGTGPHPPLVLSHPSPPSTSIYVLQTHPTSTSTIHKLADYRHEKSLLDNSQTHSFPSLLDRREQVNTPCSRIETQPTRDLGSATYIASTTTTPERLHENQAYTDAPCTTPLSFRPISPAHPSTSAASSLHSRLFPNRSDLSPSSASTCSAAAIDRARPARAWTGADAFAAALASLAAAGACSVTCARLQASTLV